MVIKEIINEKLVRYSSSDGKKIRQRETGRIYLEAIHSRYYPYTYEEVEEVPAEETATATDYEEALESLGVNFNV